MVTLTVTVSVDSAIALGSLKFSVTSGCNCLEETPETIFNTMRHGCGMVDHSVATEGAVGAFDEASSHAGEAPRCDTFC